jgi:uncharacterized integral membrane protein
MASENQPVRNTTADPAVPDPRQHDEPETAPPGTPQGDQPTSAVTPPAVAGEPAAHRPGSAGHPLERTRLGGTWVAIGCFVVVLLLLLFFILNNNNEVRVTFFGQHFDVPLGVALVLAAVCGALLVLLAGAARIMQMRSRVRKHRRVEHKASRRRAKATSSH